MLGRLADASNAAFLVDVSGEQPETVLAIYKPVAGERPLWDFPHGTLAQREAAAHVLDGMGGWDVVPPTVVRGDDAPLGRGSLQAWVGTREEPARTAVDVVPVDAVPDGWRPVLEGSGPDGRPVVVVVEDAPDVRSLAVFDVLVNNADRKGSHLLRWEGRLRAVDHGVICHPEDKLRTVLWAWAGEPIPDEDLARVERVVDRLATGGGRHTLGGLLSEDELDAVVRRGRRLLTSRVHPEPAGEWPAVPWPPL